MESWDRWRKALWSVFASAAGGLAVLLIDRLQVPTGWVVAAALASVAIGAVVWVEPVWSFLGKAARPENAPITIACCLTLAGAIHAAGTSPAPLAEVVWFGGAITSLTYALFRSRREQTARRAEGEAKVPAFSSMGIWEFAQYASDLAAEEAEFLATRHREAPKESEIKWPEGDTPDDHRDASLLWDEFSTALAYHRSVTDAQFVSRFQGRIILLTEEAIKRRVVEPDLLKNAKKRHHYIDLALKVAEATHNRAKVASAELSQNTVAQGGKASD